VGLAVTGLRTFLRYKQCAGFSNFQADDYLILVAAVCWKLCFCSLFSKSPAKLAQVVYSAETFLAYSVGAWWFGLANNAMTDEEREALQPNDPEFSLR
jgi:hypothetical protein